MWWSPITTSTAWPSSCPTPFPLTPSSTSSWRAKVRAGEMWGPRWGQLLAPVTCFIPSVHYGSWFEHVKGWLAQRQHLDIIYITYEELHEVSSASPYPPSPRPPSLSPIPPSHLPCPGPAWHSAAPQRIPGRYAGAADAVGAGAALQLRSHAGQRHGQLHPDPPRDHGPQPGPLHAQR